MATYDYISETSSQYFGTDFSANVSGGGLYVIQRTVNFATAITVLKSGTAFAIADTVELIDIPVNTWVMAVMVRVTTASDSGESDDVDFGDSTTNYFIDSMNMTTTGTSDSLTTSSTGFATSGGKVYTSADTLDAYFVAAGDTGIFELTMVCMDVD